MMNFIINTFANINNFVSLWAGFILEQAAAATPVEIAFFAVCLVGAILNAIAVHAYVGYAGARQLINTVLFRKGEHTVTFEGGHVMLAFRNLWNGVKFTVKWTLVPVWGPFVVAAMPVKAYMASKARKEEEARIEQERVEAEIAKKEEDDRLQKELILALLNNGLSLSGDLSMAAKLYVEKNTPVADAAVVEEDTVVPPPAVAPVVAEANGIVDDALPSLDELVSRREEEIASAVRAYELLNVAQAVAMITACGDKEIKAALISREHSRQRPRKGVIKHFPMA